MHPLVLSELELSEEGFPTEITSMGLLSCVKILMISEPRLLDKCFPTFTAHMRLLHLFSVLMLHELGLSAEEFRMKWFPVSMGAGFPICRRFRDIYFFLIKVRYLKIIKGVF